MENIKKAKSSASHHKHQFHDKNFVLRKFQEWILRLIVYIKNVFFFFFSFLNSLLLFFFYFSYGFLPRWKSGMWQVVVRLQLREGWSC